MLTLCRGRSCGAPIDLFIRAYRQARRMECVRRHVSNDGRRENEAGAYPEGKSVTGIGFCVFVKLLVTCLDVPTLLT